MNPLMNDGSLNANAHDFVVAIDFGGTKIAVATADMTGSILKQARLDTNASHGAQQVLERTTVTAHGLIERTAAEVGGRCVAVGVLPVISAVATAIFVPPKSMATTKSWALALCEPSFINGFIPYLSRGQADTSASSGFSRYSSLISLGPKGQVCSTKRAQRRYATTPTATQASENNMGTRPDE